MARLLVMKSGCAFDPFSIGAIVKFVKKGLVIRNEFNKIMVFEADPDPIHQDAMARVLTAIVNGGPDWVQPDWDAEYAKAKAEAKAKEEAEQKAKQAAVQNPGKAA